MEEQEWLTERFEANRAHLRAVAYRMLGSASEADDAVQEAWLRLHRSDTSEVENLGGWLTTVTARVCLDMLRSRKSRREEGVGVDVRETVEPHDRDSDPADAAVLADSVGPALLVVLETLAPAERLAFVLHDLFAVPFDEIAPIVDRTPAATRQLASRARRRVQGAEVTGTDVDVARQRAVVDAFLAAARGGDFDALLTLLDPDVVMRADAAAVAMGTQAELVGADAVAGRFLGGARALSPALVDGAVGLVWAQRGTARVVFDLTIAHGRIMGIEQLADPDVLGALELTLLDER
jgi:RNA polymerase sigma-70 factor, ECF subfamily